jgi:hypothetical protein
VVRALWGLSRFPSRAYVTIRSPGLWLLAPVGKVVAKDLQRHIPSDKRTKERVVTKQIQMFLAGFAASESIILYVRQAANTLRSLHTCLLLMSIPDQDWA